MVKLLPIAAKATDKYLNAEEAADITDKRLSGKNVHSCK